MNPHSGIDGAGSDALSADGAIIHLRPVAAEDAAALRELYDTASERSRHLRFFSLGTLAIEAELQRLARPPGPEHRAEAAWHAGRVIGVASYERLGDSQLADFAEFVSDDWQGRGIGTLLLEQLAAHARRAGIRELIGDVLPCNYRMLRVAADLAPNVQLNHDQDIARVRIATTPDGPALAAVDARERIAEQRSLRPLLAPTAVAVVGAGRAPGGIGHEVLRSIVEHGFTGSVYAVNPHADQVAGCRAYPRVSEIPGTVDLIVVAVPASCVTDVLQDAGKAGVRAAVVLSAGFGEAGSDGAELQQRLLRTAREHDIRLVGPNCIGLLNTDPRVSLDATFVAGGRAQPGGLAVASQSGAVGIALLDHATRTGVGISTFVSLGNKADVSGNDLLSYWFDDPATDAVALYLESFGNPRKFARVARAVGRRKPVLAVKSGRSAGGRRAGASHTAAAATADVAVDSLFAQAGVVRTDTLGELLDAARMMVHRPLPAGNRVGLVGNAGGINVLGADAAAAAGLVVPESAGSGGNPVDLGAGSTPDALGAAITRMAGSGEIDSMVAVFVATRANDTVSCLAAIASAADRASNIPFAVVLVGVEDAPSWLGARQAPVYPLPEPAMRALGHAARYADWRRQPLGSRPSLPDIDPAGARGLVDAVIAGGGGWQPLLVTAAILRCYGVAMVPSTVVTDLHGAVTAADALGYPVVVKAADPSIVHKSDRGLVRLNLVDEAEVCGAYQAIGAALGHSSPSVVVQPMRRRDGIELVAGVVHDPLFGSLVMAGLGGVYTELLQDRSFQLLPVTDADAARMWRRLRAAPLLTGYRGGTKTDTAALEDVLMRLGRLAEDLPEVAELDLNPLLVLPAQVEAVDAKLRLQPVGNEQDPALRLLRPAPDRPGDSERAAADGAGA